MIEAEIEVAHRNCRLLDILGGNAHAMQVSGDGHSDVLVMKGTPQQVHDFVALFADLRTQPHDVLHRTSDTVLLRTRNPTGGIVSTITAAGCAILWPTVYRAGVERYRILAVHKARLERLLKALEDHGPVRLVASFEVDVDALSLMVPMGEVAFDLSPRQLASVLAAVAAGYYEIPRRADAAGLSRTLGVSRSTAEEHLRKGEAAIVTAFARLVQASTPGASMARKGRGRPRKARVRRNPSA